MKQFSILLNVPVELDRDLRAAAKICGESRAAFMRRVVAAYAAAVLKGAKK